MYEINEEKEVAIFTSGHKKAQYLEDAVLDLSKKYVIKQVVVTKWQNLGAAHKIAEQAIILIDTKGISPKFT